MGKKKDSKKEYKVGEKRNWFVPLIILCTIAFITFSILAWNGVLEQKVEYSSLEFGNVGSGLGTPGDCDYEMLVSLNSKGAFMVGRNINVTIELTALRKLSELKNSELYVIFPGASPYPMPPELAAEPSRGIAKVLDAGIPIKFISDSITAQGNTTAKFKGEGDIIYWRPEMLGGSVMLPWDTFGKHSFNLLINMVPQTKDKFIRSNDLIYLAPMETRLQLKNNNAMIILAAAAAYLAVVQILISLRNRRESNR